MIFSDDINKFYNKYLIISLLLCQRQYEAGQKESKVA